MRTLMILMLATTLLGSCVSREAEPLLPQLGVVSPPQITIDPKTGVHSIEVDVLILNIAALPWPISSNRTEASKWIGRELASMRAHGEEPDIVLIQEGFRRSTKEMISLSGYPNWVRGPATDDRMPNHSERAPDEFVNESYFWKGERLGKVMNSGLYILSNWPIRSKDAQPFYRHECAGFDCGSNKGILSAVIEIPGMPGHLEVFTTHMNSRGSTGVPDERSLTAHNLQIDSLDDELDENWSGIEPMIFGGDFNMKQARARLDYMVGDRGQTERPTHIVHHYCHVIVKDCDIRISFDGDEPWLDTNDLQGWIPGKYVSVRPIMVDATFDEPHPRAPKIKNRYTLSDHDGLLVRYRLSWNPGDM